VCVYHTKDADVAEAALSGLMQEAASSLSDAKLRYVCDAGHILSHLYLRMDKPDRAKLACERTLKARTRLFRKTHESQYESIALLSHIYNLLGNNARAKIFINMIPGRQCHWFNLRLLPPPIQCRLEEVRVLNELVAM